MRLCFVVDGGSPIARAWIEPFVERGDEVSVISSYPLDAQALPGASVFHVPTVLTGLQRDSMSAIGAARTVYNRLRCRAASSPAMIRVLDDARCWLSPLALRRHAARLNPIIQRIRPDIVHAMRIPFEGMLAAVAVPESIPLITSSWGNDFTLYAGRTRMMRRQTRLTLVRSAGLHADCRRDVPLAEQCGFHVGKPICVAPGNGGVRTDIFCPGPAKDAHLRARLGIPDNARVVLNPRGVRRYVRQDSFFQAIPLLLRHLPNACFVCTGMASSAEANRWVGELRIQHAVRLLPGVGRAEMADLFRLAEVSVSPSLHDGTPNTLLEAMASGCFPVAGDLASLREWIDHGVNGLLCDPCDSDSLAAAMLSALRSHDLRLRAGTMNRRLIEQRAEQGRVFKRIEAFYDVVIAGNRRGVES